MKSLLQQRKTLPHSPLIQTSVNPDLRPVLVCGRVQRDGELGRTWRRYSVSVSCCSSVCLLSLSVISISSSLMIPSDCL